MDKDHITLGEVVEVHQFPQLDKDATFNYKWITQKVDQEKINLSFEIDQKFKEKLNQHLHHKEQQKILEEFNISNLDRDEFKNTEFV